MGLALPLRSSVFVHNSLRFSNQTRRTRLSSVDATNRRRPAVAMGPASTGRPVFVCRQAAVPCAKRNRHGENPVAVFTATRLPQGASGTASSDRRPTRRRWRVLVWLSRKEEQRLPEPVG